MEQDGAENAASGAAGATAPTMTEEEQEAQREEWRKELAKVSWSPLICPPPLPASIPLLTSHVSHLLSKLFKINYYCKNVKLKNSNNSMLMEKC